MTLGVQNVNFQGCTFTCPNNNLTTGKDTSIAVIAVAFFGWKNTDMLGRSVHILSSQTPLLSLIPSVVGRMAQ